MSGIAVGIQRQQWKETGEIQRSLFRSGYMTKL